MFLRAEVVGTAGGRSTPDNHRRAHHSVGSDDDGAKRVATRKSELTLSARLIDMNPSSPSPIHPY